MAASYRRIRGPRARPALVERGRKAAPEVGHQSGCPAHVETASILRRPMSSPNARSRCTDLQQLLERPREVWFAMCTSARSRPRGEVAGSAADAPLEIARGRQGGRALAASSAPGWSRGRRPAAPWATAAPIARGPPRGRRRVHQDRNHVEARRIVRGVEAIALRRCSGERLLSRGERGARLAQLELARSGTSCSRNARILRLGLRAQEVRDAACRPRTRHERDRTHAELRGELGVLVGVHLDEPPAPAGLPLELLEQRAECAAGPAPRRPEVHHHGHFAEASSTSRSKEAREASIISSLRIGGSRSDRWRRPPPSSSRGPAQAAARIGASRAACIIVSGHQLVGGTQASRTSGVKSAPGPAPGSRRGPWPPSHSARPSTPVARVPLAEVAPAPGSDRRGSTGRAPRWRSCS